MRVLGISLFALLLGGAPLATHAEGPSFYVTPFGAFRMGGQFEDATTGATRSLASHAGFALALGRNPHESAQQYEVFYSRQETRVGGNTPFDIDVEYFHFGGTFDYGDEPERYSPYVVGGLGATRMTPHESGLDQETHWSVSLGGGVKVPLAKRVLARLELRGYFTFLNSNSDIFCISANGSANCAIRVRGNGLFQGEALAGVSFKF